MLMKKLLLSFVMMLMATAVAWADYAVIDGVSYYISKSSYDLSTEGYPDGYVAFVQSLEGDVYSGEINIPSAVTYEGEQYPVVKIDQNAFKDATVTKVTIPATVQVIEPSAFQNCANLTSIDLPEGLKYIGMSAFEYCPITSMTIPGTVTYIRGYALPTSLTSLTLSAGEETLAFEYPAVGMRDDVSITDLNIDRNYHYDNMPLSDKVKRVTFGSHVTTIDRSAFEGCTLEQAITFPYSIKEIGLSAFQSCTVPAITLNEGLETINNYAFNGCTATFNGLPSTLTSIGECAFQRTTGLKTANIPSGVTKLEGYTFMYSAVETVTIPGSITEVGRYEFSDCQNLKTVTIENGATVLALNDIFDNCDNVETMNIDRNFTVDSSNPAFSRTAQMTVNLGSHVTEIPLHAFQECSFTAFTIPGTVKYVRGRSLPTTLTSLTLLAGEETLTFDQMALGQFASDVNVTDLNIDRNYTNYGGKPLSEKVKRVTFGNHVTAIESGAFQSCSLEQAITFPSSLKEIGYNAFRSCTVSAITLNEGLETIGDYAFNQCTATFNGIPSTLTSIGQSAFSQCTGLTGALVIPAGVTQLAMSTFLSLIHI